VKERKKETPMFEEGRREKKNGYKRRVRIVYMFAS
jgi:hypothetical protein